MSKYVVATAYGDPDVLALREEEIGEPDADEALIEVRAAGVNPVDVKMYSGAFGNDPEALPRRLGLEAAGVDIATGEEVIAYPASGAYADRLLVSKSNVFPKPEGMEWAAAAGLMLTGVTASHLIEATNVGEGDTVVVHGGSGGVGLMAVQLAKLRGARAIATASPRNHDLLRELGAEPVEYGEGLEERLRDMAPDGIDSALDVAGTDEAVDVSLSLVDDRNRIATIVAFQRAVDAGFKALGGGPGADPGTEVRNAARSDLVDSVSDGVLRVVVAGTYPLSEVAVAHRRILDGHTTGKLALIP